MKKADRSKILNVAETMTTLLNHMKWDAHCYSFEQGMRELRSMVEALPKGGQYKSYNARIKNAIKECQSRYDLTRTYFKMKEIVIELR